MVHHVKPFWLHLCYFLFLSSAGYLSLKVSKTRTNNNLINNLDLFFTAVSSATTSSMSIVEMEVFSNDQLIIIIILMLLGGEVFISMLGLQLRKCTINDLSNNSNNDDENYSKHYNNSIRILGYIVLGYLIIVQLVGSNLVTMYMSLTPSATNVLKSKGLHLHTFSFIVISTFSSCGFTPTNESLMIFRKNNPALLLILIPQIFLGNTLYPLFLRLVIWVLERFTKKKEFDYMLNNCEELKFVHLLSSKKTWFLSATTLAFLVLQLVVFCCMEWNSGVMEDMNSYQKFVGSLFQTSNTRYSGEAIVDFSLLSPAVLVLFTIMMYLPPYTSFLPIGQDEQQQAPEKDRRMKKLKKNMIDNLLFSQLSYLVIFVVVICITERKSLEEDPLNYNVVNIVFEVISAYGNVGLSTGYSCKRRLKTYDSCEEKVYGFSGRWSDGGKVALILVMFFGRLKNFSMHGGKAWKML
ncbi:cation transporter HKT1;3-like [Beta vulgaris subsp. vulgaris]|uniref:cation transporter HKT1;3-like n=1 Tax=Beta vulgaris subsp. vulgaris TaxID=3555 RepID=UPI002546EC92|nr:cation transporter HKT1;3-like [Beta vulgaris subsp. vulgaris]